ncbi:Gamma-tubulin complex component [Paragonimus heterotremus]|uniref:Gamma-tubulin complex component n=1 Tax=Paragonimus heterotremus TaxID=100268 RepID=A0A8J4SVZ1_9TREM|nr:Gamma-tubulin complex component [Paragonimus heterotremus]
MRSVDSASETDDNEVSCAIAPAFSPTVHATYPRHWDNVNSLNDHPKSTYLLSESHITNCLQPEYWWRRNKATINCFKRKWLMLNNLEDNRNEMTEYQIVREIIWSLLGARSSYVFYTAHHPETLLSIRVAPAGRVSLANLPYTTLDAVLDLFARFISRSLILRTLVQFVTAQTGSLHPCIVAFGMCLNDFLATLDHHLQALQTVSRGPGIFTLTRLYFDLLLWIRRVGIFAGLVMQLTAGHLGSLVTDPTMHIRMLDMLHHVCSTFGDCSNDPSFIELLNTCYFRTFLPYLYSTVYLLSGKASALEYLRCLFVSTDSDITPTDPDFWHMTFVCHMNKDEPPPASINLALVPRIFYPVLYDLIASLKALCTLIALSSEVTRPELLEEVTAHPEDTFRMLADCWCHTVKEDLSTDDLECALSYRREPTLEDADFLTLHRELMDSVRTPEVTAKPAYSNTDSFVSRTTVSSLQSNLLQLVRDRCDLLNRHLIKVLLDPDLMPIRRSLGTGLFAVGAVYLFGVGDRMNDFARQLFHHVHRFRGPWHSDLVGLTLRLRAQFESHSVHDWLASEIFAFGFVSTSSVPPVSDTAPVLNSFDLVRVDFKAEWPVTILLNTAALDVYNGVFRFLLKIKYVKWSLETLVFSQLNWLFSSDPNSYHRMLLLRFNMLYVFAGLHDFLVHRVEGLRRKFAQHWNLQDTTQIVHKTKSEHPSSGTLSELIRSHVELLSGLESVCLLTDASRMLRTELNVICQMALQLESLWLGPNSKPLDIAEQLPHLTALFHNHVQFLAQLLTRAVRLSNAMRLLSLADTFLLAASSTKQLLS